MTSRPRDPVAIVTGAGAGLGRLVVEAIAAEGVAVVAADVDGDLAAKVASGIAARGQRAVGLRADVLVDDDIESMVGAAEELGGPHLLVNNAGGWSASGRQFPESAPEEWGAVLDLNLRGPMRAIQRCLGPMARAGGGAIVNVASSAGVELTAYGSPEYAAAKAGLVRLTTALGDLGARAGIRVSCVVPGWIGLPRAHRERAAMSQEELADAGALVPPDRAVSTILWLATDGSVAGRVVVLEGDESPRLVEGDRWC